MQNLTPYLNFDGNCRQAMSFYAQGLGAELVIAPFPDAQGKPSTDPAARVMHSKLTAGGREVLMASDTQPGMPFHQGNNVYVCIQCDALDEIERMFKALSEKGNVTMPLQDTFWNARFGMLCDRFGVYWMLNCDLKKEEKQ